MKKLLIILIFFAAINSSCFSDDVFKNTTVLKVIYPYAYSGVHSSWMVVVVKTEENAIENLFYLFSKSRENLIRLNRKYDIHYETADIEGLIGNSHGNLENVKTILKIIPAD